MDHGLTLVIIADDLTGSFDTGVQFKKRGASVSLTLLDNLDTFPAAADVVVIDTESRHDQADIAYEKNMRAVCWAKNHGARHLYIKTDSGLRGNIGVSLKAALDGTGDTIAVFAPAYPDMKRYTKNGCQFIDGVPVHLSVFGRDPFDPVTAPTIRELVSSSGLATEELQPAGAWPPIHSSATVWILDAQSNDDLMQIAQRLHQQGLLHITAGCAAFAAALYSCFNLPTKCKSPDPMISPLLVVCGSVNPITRSQILYAQELGFERRVISPASLTNDGFWYGPLGAAWRKELIALVQKGKHVIIDTGLESTASYTSLHGTIAARLGWLMHELLIQLQDVTCTPLLIGGDTLMGFFSVFAQPDIQLEGELKCGVSIFSISLAGRRIRLLSKSGGFGEATLLEKLTDAR